MSGPKRNPDRLNTIGIVVVGICGAVLVYVTIVALQAFYMNDTSELQTMADYGGNDTQARSLRTAQVHNITEVGKNAVAAPKPGEQPKPDTFRINIDDAMKQVVESAKVDPSMLVPTQGKSDKATIKPIPGRPQPLATPAPAAPAAPTDGAAAGSGAGSGSAAPAAPATNEPAVPQPTGGLGQGGTNPQGGAAAGSGATPAPAPKVNLPVEQGTAPKGTGAGSGSAAPKPAGAGTGSGSAAPKAAPKGNAP